MAKSKEHLAKRSAVELEALYSKPLPSSRSGALYNAFSYPTKISPEAIAVFIATHTLPGAKILDVFGGSGTTGLAALLCDKPTEEMLKMASELGVSPTWGPRDAEIFELSTLGAFVASVLSSPPDPESFSHAAKSLIERTEKTIGWAYEAVDPDGNIGKIRHSIWSDVLVCPKCSSEISYWDAVVRREPLRLEGAFMCPKCAVTVQLDNCTRAVETVQDHRLGISIERKKRVPAQIYGRSTSGNWVRSPTEADFALFAKTESAAIPSSAPIAEVFKGDLYRSGYHKGISHLHHFYTSRNFLVVATLWETANEFPADIRDALKLLILSYNATHSTLMTRVVVKSGQSDFVLTGAQSGVLYVSGLPVEKNVLEGMKRKTNALKKAFAVVRGSRSKVRVTNASSTSLSLPDASIDYVFTDPPFGDYIPYAEINQINELWLGRMTDRNEEIIVSGSQGKGVADYSQLMGRVFSEMSRVLKPEGLATVVFHSASSSVWRALSSAYASAGFAVRSTSVLDKLQASFKQVVSTVSVKGDPLLLLAKGSVPIGDRTQNEIIEEILDLAGGLQDSERDPQRLYSRFVSRCLELGVDVRMGAREFYARAETALKI